jgi:hypothetical protein
MLATLIEDRPRKLRFLNACCYEQIFLEMYLMQWKKGTEAKLTKERNCPRAFLIKSATFQYLHLQMEIWQLL